MAEVVAILRDALASAERGEIVGVALATTHSDGATGTVYRWGSGGHATLCHAAHRLSHRMMHYDPDDSRADGRL